MINGEPIVLGGKGETASIFVTGLTETDTVTATKDGRTWNGVWGTSTVYTPYDTPTMTGYTTPSGEVIYNIGGFTENRGMWKAFDKNLNEAGYATDSSGTLRNPSGMYVGFSFGKSIKVTSVLLTKVNFAIANAVGTFVVEASNNGTDWSVISNEMSFNHGEDNTTEFTVTETICRYIRVKCTGANKTVYGFGLFEIEITAFEETQVYGHLISNLNSYGTYTVTATNQEQTKTATESVLVDMAEEYDIGMSFRTYLYNLGDECEGMTGGWLTDAPNSAASATKNATNIVLGYTQSSSFGANASMYTTNQIDISDYSCVKVQHTNTNSQVGIRSYCGGYTTTDYSTDIDKVTSFAISEYGSTLDVLWIMLNSVPSSNNGTSTISKVWLE